MSRVRGRSFKITKNQAKGYGYARASYRRNPGVTSIAAINGRGSYAGSRSARSVMSKLKRNARGPAARAALTASKKRAFKAKLTRNRSTSSAQSASSKRNIRKAQTARRVWGQKLKRGKRVRVGRASYGKKPKARRLKPGVYIANRRKKAGKKTMARRRRKSATGATKKRRRSSKRRRKTSIKAAAPKRRRRRKAKKASAGRKTRRRSSKRRRRSSRKMVANRRRSRRKLRANPRRRRRSKAAAPRRRRRRAKAGSPRRRRRRSAKAAAPRRRRRKLKANRRKSGRRRKGLKANRRRRSSGRRRKALKANRRRRHRRNGRRLFRKNGAGDFLKMGAVLFAGFGLHRLLTNLVDQQLLTRLLPAPAAPAATSGFSLEGNRGLIASILVGGGTAFLANKVIKNPETKKLIIGGIAVSTVQGIAMSLLKMFMPSAANMLSGPEDGTAARLSAMYGLGAGASIMPRYAAINGGMGEYFREPMNGMGEYFREPMNGIGEYISATNGLGTYGPNDDLYQAAAGMGNHDYSGNHIDPSGDLDRQLTIAEAAAGVGALSPFEAAAGIGPMQAAAGFGAIDTVPSADTWIPGSADGQLWAGVKRIDQSQSATEMVPAGTLQSAGGQGIFG